MLGLGTLDPNFKYEDPRHRRRIFFLLLATTIII